MKILTLSIGVVALISFGMLAGCQSEAVAPETKPEEARKNIDPEQEKQVTEKLKNWKPVK